MYLTYTYNFPLLTRNKPPSSELVVTGVDKSFTEGIGSVALVVRELYNIFYLHIC